jgi:hypothetical protein
LKFFLQGMGLLFMLGLLIIWCLHIWIGIAPAAVIALLTGIILAWLFVGSGFVSFYRSRLKPERSFSRIFLYTIFGRLTAMMVILVLLFKFTVINHLPLLISLLICYFIFQIWEVVSFNRLQIGK